jgi:hypothetical protein
MPNTLQPFNPAEANRPSTEGQLGAESFEYFFIQQADHPWANGDSLAATKTLNSDFDLNQEIYYDNNIGGVLGKSYVDFWYEQYLDVNELKKKIRGALDTLPGDTLSDIWRHIEAAATSKADAPSTVPPLPTKAPALWAERTSGREVSPVDFIRAHYGPWIGNGLTRVELKRLDAKLYAAYATWISKHRNPQDDLRIPTKSEMLMSIAAVIDPSEMRNAVRVHEAERQRQYRMGRKK